MLSTVYSEMSERSRLKSVGDKITVEVGDPQRNDEKFL